MINKIPNILTITRIASMPIFAVLFLVNFPYHFLVAGLLYVVLDFTDIFDGVIARKYKCVSDFGKFWDPVADKIMMTVALVCMVAYGICWTQWAGALMTILMIVRDLAVNGLRMMAASKGKVMAADMGGKVKTWFINISIPICVIGFQWVGVSDYFAYVVTNLGYAGWAAAVLISLVSGVFYFVRNRDVLTNHENG